MVGEKIPGPEDFVFDTSTDQPRLIVSGSTRPNPSPSSGLYEIPVGGQLEARRLRIAEDNCASAAPPETKCFLDPHGIFLVPPAIPGESPLLYVVNHHSAPHDHGPCFVPPGENGMPPLDGERSDSIERYRVERDCLVFEKRFRDPTCGTYLKRPNDVAALRDGTVYVTNLIGSDHAWGRLMEVFGASRSHVVRYDPGSGAWSNASGPIAMANGIEIDEPPSRNGASNLADTHVYVAASGAGTVQRYTISNGGDLIPDGDPIHIGGTVDNLSWDADKRVLYVTSYCSTALLLHGHLFGATDILQIDPLKWTSAFVRHIPHGSLSTGSTAAPFAGRMYVGQVFNSGLLMCAPESK